MRGRPRKKKNVPRGTFARHIVHHFKSDNALSWMLFSKVLDRIETFCTAFDADCTAEIMLPIIKKLFVENSEDLGLYGVLEGSEVIGHSIALREKLGGKEIILIYQGELDQVDSASVKQILNAYLEWAKSKKITELRIVTHRPDGFERKWGFTPKNVIMKMEVPKGEEDGSRQLS